MKIPPALRHGTDLLMTLALLGLILDAVTGRLREVMDTDMLILYLKGELQSYRTALSNEKPASPAERMHEQVKDRKRFLEDGQRASYLSHEQQRRNAQLIKILEDLERAVAPESDGAAAFQIVKQSYEKRVGELQKVAQAGRNALSHAFQFCEEVFGDGQEMLILVTELTINPHAAKFISRYGCPEYFAHNKELLFYERKQDIIAEVERMDLDE